MKKILMLLAFAGVAAASSAQQVILIKAYLCALIKRNDDI